MPAESLAGRLLVAAPVLRDPNFEQTVVLLLQHGRDGALGLVLNRPSATPVGDHLPPWQEHASDPGVFFVGGPVETTAAICLGLVRADAGEVAGFAPAHGLLGTVDLDGDVDVLRRGLTALRVFIGYAGWSAGQLEGEIGEDAWFIVDGRPDDPFSREPGTLWRAVLRRQAGRLALLSGYVEDPSAN